MDLVSEMSHQQRNIPGPLYEENLNPNLNNFRQKATM